MKFEIPHRFTRAVLATVDIECAEDAPRSTKLGLAVKAAVRARANLAYANLARANLARANLADACLTRADLAGANLAYADLAGANLAYADLAYANLAGASLARADLADACLTRADLAGANLAYADLAGANLAGAVGVIDAGVPNGFRVVAYLWNGRLMLRAGCKTFTAEEAEPYWRHRPERAECLAALFYIRDVARLRGWQTAEQTTSQAAE